MSDKTVMLSDTERQLIREALHTYWFEQQSLYSKEDARLDDIMRLRSRFAKLERSKV